MALPNMTDLFKQAGDMQAKLAEMQEKLRLERIEGSVAGGLVRIVVNGLQEVQEVHIDASLVNSGNVMRLEDMVKQGMAEAMRESQRVAASEMEKLTGGISPQALMRGLGGGGR